MTTINKSLAASGETLIYNHECELLWPFPVYNVYTYGNHGTVSANPNGGIEGTEVTLSNTPEVFYQFNGYTINGATLKNTNQFDINDSNVYVTGNFVSTLPEGVVCLYAHPDEVTPINKTGDYWTPALSFDVKTTGYNYYLVTYKEKFARSSNNDMPYGGFSVNSWNTYYGFHIYYNANSEEPISQYSGMHCVEDDIWNDPNLFNDAIDSIRSGRHGDGNYSYYYDNPTKPASSFITHSVINDAPLQQAQEQQPGWYSANWSVYEDTTFVGRTLRGIHSGFHGASIYGNAYVQTTPKNYCPITARDFYIFACNTRQPLVNLLNQLS